MKYTRGDVVKIISRPEDGEKSSPRWPAAMDSTLNQFGVVFEVREDRVGVAIDPYIYWWYRLDWVEHVILPEGHGVNNTHLAQELPQ